MDGNLGLSMRKIWQGWRHYDLSRYKTVLKVGTDLWEWV